MNKKKNDIVAFTDALRQQHMRVISKMKAYIVNFPQLGMKADTNHIEKKIKRYMSKLKIHVSDLNRNFNSHYENCKCQINTFKRECHSPTEQLRSEKKYNIKYIKNLHILDDSINDTLGHFLKSSISCSMKNLMDLCQRNNVVDTYKIISSRLSSHFNISPPQNDPNTCTQKTKMDSFIQRMIVRVHHHIIRVPKKDNKEEEEEAKRLQELKDKFLEERKEFAMILFNKASAYMQNSIKRRSELNTLERGLLKRMKDNDIKVQEKIHDLQQFRKANGNLIISLNKDNEINTERIKKCGILQNTKLKCEEMSRVYQMILSSYSEQSEALEKIFTIIRE